MADTEAAPGACVARHDVTFAGVETGRPIVFAHGFGCDQYEALRDDVCALYVERGDGVS